MPEDGKVEYKKTPQNPSDFVVDVPSAILNKRNKNQYSREFVIGSVSDCVTVEFIGKLCESVSYLIWFCLIDFLFDFIRKGIVRQMLRGGVKIDGQAICV